METLKRLGLLVGLSALLVACGTGDADTGVDAESTDAEVTVEEPISSREEVEEEEEVEEVEEVEEEEEVEVEEVEEVEVEEVEGEDKSTPTDISEKDIEESVRITNIEDDKVIITDKDGEVVEELTLEENEGTEEE